jgi:hypothetical protein
VAFSSTISTGCGDQKNLQPVISQVAFVQFWIGEHEVVQIAGVHPHHLLVCDALGLDPSWYEAPSAHKIDQFSQSP